MWANLVGVADVDERCYWRVMGVPWPTCTKVYLTLGYLTHSF